MLKKNCLVCKTEFYKAETCSLERWRNQRRFCSVKCKGVGTAYMFKESNNPSWRGDAASYTALHHWIKKQRGVPGSCTHCGSTGRNQWASISHNAKREIKDYMPLCSSCHKIYDLAGKQFDTSLRKYNLTKALN